MAIAGSRNTSLTGRYDCFEVTANEGMQRYTTVALKDEQGKILQTIIFRQLGTCTEVHVETKGELENELAGYDYANIESLKITGVLNDVDFCLSIA